MDCQNYYITNALNALGNQIASLQDTSAINNQCQTYIFTLPTSITTNGCNNNFSINQVSYSSLNYRMWELKISATLLQPTSSILYIFNPLCLLPPNNVSLKNIRFSSKINGYISTSNGVLSLNGSETNEYVNLDWQPNNTTLTVNFSSLPLGDVYANLIFKDSTTTLYIFTYTYYLAGYNDVFGIPTAFSWCFNDSPSSVTDGNYNSIANPGTINVQGSACNGSYTFAEITLNDSNSNNFYQIIINCNDIGKLSANEEQNIAINNNSANNVTVNFQMSNGNLINFSCSSECVGLHFLFLPEAYIATGSTVVTNCSVGIV
jgi:hypothetical protein